MQVQNEQKRRAIMAAAGRLFAERPFHEVTLDRVAAAAKVGKGTVYVYFAGKEQLYVAVVGEGLGELVERVRTRLAATPAAVWPGIAAVVDELLLFSRRYPHLFTLMRTGQSAASEELLAARAALASVVESLLRDGIARGEIADARPELTAHFVLALVRAALLHGPGDLPHAAVAEHILHLLQNGLHRGPTNGTPA